MANDPSSFSMMGDGLMRVLKTPVVVGPALDNPQQVPVFKQYVGIWDTGATASVISQKIVNEGGLKPIGMTMVHGVHGQQMAEVFLICIGLPNHVGFPKIRVTKGDLGNVDMLIGMDIIARGDFAITHHQGKTCFSFRYPSMERIDFTGSVPRGAPTPNPASPSSSIFPKVGRNDKCPCGSGLKYKRCHGK